MKILWKMFYKTFFRKSRRYFFDVFLQYYEKNVYGTLILYYKCHATSLNQPIFSGKIMLIILWDLILGFRKLWITTASKPLFGQEAAYLQPCQD